ncbi:12159_t:CDS:1, partial [Racocetra persica]
MKFNLNNTQSIIGLSSLLQHQLGGSKKEITSTINKISIGLSRYCSITTSSLLANKLFRSPTISRLKNYP